MEFSEFLRKGMIESFYGGIITRYHIKRRRRVTLFFGDIFINYVKECEKSGFRDEMLSAGREWMFLYFDVLVPPAMKKLPIPLLNVAMKKAWKNIGLMDDFSIEKKGDTVTIRTKNEAITRVIGNNGFSVGLFMGILNSLYGSVDIVRIRQASRDSVYVFKVGGGEVKIEGKTKSEYDNLNRPQKGGGMNLESAVRKKILELEKGNKIKFRGAPVYLVENTIFHIIGNHGLLLERVQEISYEFFRRMVTSEATKEKKLLLLKTLLQSMGWGIVKITIKDGSIEIDIKSPPYGAQKGNDNWDFLIRAILGYLWIIDRGYSIGDKYERNRHLRVIYSR